MAQQIDIASLKKKMAENTIFFGKICLPNTFTLKSPPFHYELDKNYRDKNIRQLNIIAPRDHAKSSIVALVWVLHHIFFDPGPKFIVLVSKTEGHAIRLLETIKNALNFSPVLVKLFGYYGEHSAIKWATNEIVLKDGTAIITRGTGQMVRGLKHNNQRPTLVILDDPEDENNTKTPEAMENNLRWLLASLIPVADIKRGRTIVIGTPLHQRCMVEALASMKDWKTLRYQALYDEGPRDKWYTLWPDKFTVDFLVARKKALEEHGRVSIFYREYQCVCIGDEDQLFKAEYFQYYGGQLLWENGEHWLRIVLLNDIVVEEKRRVHVFMGIDPASSISQSADFSAIIPIAVDANGNVFILPYFRGRLSPMNLAKKILEMYGIYKPIRTRIESTGYQEMLREYLRQQEHIPGLEIKEAPRNSKSKRLESLEPLFYQRKVYFRKTEQQALIDEFLMFPRGKHEDGMDGFYYAQKNVFAPQDQKWKTVKEREEEDFIAQFDFSETSYMSS